MRDGVDAALRDDLTRPVFLRYDRPPSETKHWVSNGFRLGGVPQSKFRAPSWRPVQARPDTRRRRTRRGNVDYVVS
jgi:hypothetical protein